MLNHEPSSESRAKGIERIHRAERSFLEEEADGIDIPAETPSGNEGYGALKPAAQNIFPDIQDTGTSNVRVYKDKDGLPVTYDTAIHQPREQTKSDAISVLSHELLSPLTLIKGYTATLLQLKYAISEEQEEQYLHGIESACNRLIRLLENLRDVTRLEETDSIATQAVSLSDLLRQIVSEVQSQTTKHIIKLRPPAHLPRVRINPEKIAQVLNNLLINAIKYSPQGGDIQVEVRMVQDEPELKRLYGDTPAVKIPCLIVCVADNGIGIPVAELEMIFEKFYRASNKLTHTIPGAGLGLYICKTIVQAHGGRIWARNGLRGGSSLCFSLPLEPAVLKKQMERGS